MVGGSTFRGVFDVQRFGVQNGNLVARGLLRGTLTDVLGRARPVPNQAAVFQVAQLRGTCRILHLVLGPLDLDRLGLRIQLNRVAPLAAC